MTSLAGTRQRKLQRARRWIGILLIAWTFITGGIVSIGAAYAGRANDLRILIGALAGPLLVGIILMLALGTVRLLEDAWRRSPEAQTHLERKFGKHVFGRR